MSTKGLPEDWQEQAMIAIKKMQREDSATPVFGLSFPTGWAELTTAVRGGDVQKLLGIKAAAFAGDQITRLYDPTVKKIELKVEPKTKAKK